MQPDTVDETTDLLVAYALGALEPEEMERVGELLDSRPDLRTLLAELRATAVMLPYALPEASAPADMRQRVLDHAVGRGSRSSPNTDFGRRLRGWFYLLGGLATATVVALVFALVQFGASSTQLADAQRQLDQARQQLADAQQQLAARDTELASLADERNQLLRFALAANGAGSLKGSGGVAGVLRADDGTLLVAAQLPPLAPGQVYQLWTIAGDNGPQSAGVFRVDAQGFGLVAVPAGAPSGATLAVTAEPGPTGSPGPTTDVLVVGQVS